MQPTQFLLHLSGSFLVGTILTFLVNGGPICGKLGLHFAVFGVCWLTGLVSYACGRCSR